MTKDYVKKGKEILDILGTEHFYKPIKLGTYKIVDCKGKGWTVSTHEKAKLEVTCKKQDKKLLGEGAMVYVYIKNDKEVMYIGQTTILTRIQTPSSLGGFNKKTGEVNIPSKKHGFRNVSTFLQTYEIVKQNNTLDVYVIKAKEFEGIELDNGIKLRVFVKPQDMEKALQDEYKSSHKQLPLMHEQHKDCYKYADNKQEE